MKETIPLYLAPFSIDFVAPLRYQQSGTMDATHNQCTELALSCIICVETVTDIRRAR